ncbi:MAG: N-acetylmuramoyl-L-alanine amidase [Verrucomicrobiales bacterium]|nr:N-acetylmuramoyl-L-alanine amidase [Verrucomicrobiales bacterium]
MKATILKSLRKPIVWGVGVALALFALALFQPGLQTQPKPQPAQQQAAAPTPAAPQPVVEPPAAKPTPPAATPVDPVQEAMAAVEKASASGSAHFLPTLEAEADKPAPTPAAPTKPTQPTAPAEVAATKPPPASKPADAPAPAASAAPTEEPDASEDSFVGPPSPEEMTQRLLLAFAGPPSPAAYGPPAPEPVDDADEFVQAGKAEVLAEAPDKKAATEKPSESEKEKDAKAESAKLAMSGGAEKPTARVTAPASTKPAPEPTADDFSHRPDELEATVEQPLPPTSGHSWEIVKVNGRDYVTGRSIQSFYRFSTYKIEGKHVWFRMPNLIIKGEVGGQDLLINNVKFILSFPVITSGSEALISRLDLCKLIDPVLRPSFIGSENSFDTVVIDAGHGGHDSGAKGVYGYEKNYALSLGFSLRDALKARGFKVVMTRTTDTFITLGDRVRVANDTPKSIFVALHFNSGGSAATGIETYALTPQGSASSLARGGGFSNSARIGNAFDSENITLATAVHAQVVHRFKLVDRGIKRARWTVLSGCRRPGILFEGGFVTNSKECQLIASEKYRAAVAAAIADAIVNYRRALNPKLVRSPDGSR